MKKIIFSLLLLSLLTCTSYPITSFNQEFLHQKLKEYYLQAPEKLFSYTYPTEVYSPILEKSFALDAAIENIAKAKHLQLNNSPFFNIKFITNPEKTRAYHLKPKVFKSDVGKLVSFTTADGITLQGTYFNRNSDKLIIVGPGFTNEREKMSPFIHIFAEYDVLLFDYRGHGHKKMKFADPSTWNFNIFRHLFGVDPSQVRLGLEEEKDIFAVVDSMRQRKKYTQVVGVGICYSALIFAKAASLRHDLFTHLVLDGAWFSLESFTTRLSHDLKMVVTPQRGGWQNFWLTKQEWGRDLIKSLAETLFRVKFKSIAMLDYLPHLSPDLPILFFYGKNDLTISRHEFEIMWQATSCKEKTVVITSNPHVWNHLKQKELYKLIVGDLFVNLPHNSFIACLQDKDRLIAHEASIMAAI